MLLVSSLSFGLISCTKSPVFSEGAKMERIDDEWARVNRAWLHQQYESSRLMLKALRDCKAANR